MLSQRAVLTVYGSILAPFSITLGCLFATGSENAKFAPLPHGLLVFTVLGGLIFDVFFFFHVFFLGGSRESLFSSLHGPLSSCAEF